MIAKLRALSLESVDAPLHARASAGFAARGKVIGEAISDELAFYRGSLGLQLELELYVLSEADWRAANPLPYGLSFSTHGVLGMPAKGGVVADEFLAMEQATPQPLRDRITAMGKRWPEAVDDLVDLIGYHETGHAFEGAFGIAPPNHWVDELVASYFAYAFLKAKRPALADVWETMAAADLATHHPEHRSLADFEKLYFGVGVPNYAWYEQVFFQRVVAIYASQQLAFLESMKRAFPTGAVAPNEEEMMARLERIAPGFRGWASELR